MHHSLTRLPKLFPTSLLAAVLLALFMLAVFVLLVILPELALAQAAPAPAPSPAPPAGGSLGVWVGIVLGGLALAWTFAQQIVATTKSQKDDDFVRKVNKRLYELEVATGVDINRDGITGAPGA